ncbi:MAG: phage tail protein [Myxococcota bacterium]
MKRARKWMILAPVGLAGVLVAYVAGRAHAAGIPNDPLVYSGTLTSDDGTPVNATLPVELSLWRSGTSTDQADRACLQGPADVAVSAGRFSVTLDGACVAAVLDHGNLWVELGVDGDTLPRTRLTAVPYAVESSRASEASGALAAQLQQMVDALVPVGTVVAFAGTVPPTGWLMCDGSALSRTQYAALFNAIGTAHGAPDEGTFNLPDYRGRFLRGVDGDAGRDPDRATRQAMAPGGNAGDVVGSIQQDTTQRHQHTDPGHNHAVADPGHTHAVSDPGHAHIYPFLAATGAGGIGAGPTWAGANASTYAAVTGISLYNAYTGVGVASAVTGLGEPAAPARISDETRPANAAVHWIIKF